VRYKMKIQLIKCYHCGDFLFSRAEHDFRYCTCGKTAVDCGLKIEDIWVSYRMIGNVLPTDWYVVDIDVTESELYNDWNYNETVYGVYKNDKE